MVISVYLLETKSHESEQQIAPHPVKQLSVKISSSEIPDLIKLRYETSENLFLHHTKSFLIKTRRDILESKSQQRELRT